MTSVLRPIPPTQSKAQKVTLAGSQATLLATLWSRWQDLLSPQPILDDKWAVETIEKINYNFTNMNVDVFIGTWVCMRARILDRWVCNFLAVNPCATVLHLACGLDSRCLRMKFGPGVRWIDLDLPDVVALRQQLVPAPEGNYTLIAGSASVPEEWLNSIPADRPTIVIMEGLTQYLPKEDVWRLVVDISRRFAIHGGQLGFDSFSTEAIRAAGLSKLMKDTKSVMLCGIDDPKELESWADGLNLIDDQRPVDLTGYGDVHKVAQLAAQIPSVTFIKDGGRNLLYNF